ncbi:hypothetical protein O5290_27640 [Escherichia coli]|nr:hypothetical protein [Escherichia coli]
MDIAATNNDVFAVKTDGGAKVVLFERLSQYIADESKRDDFCRAIINKLVLISASNASSRRNSTSTPLSLNT